MDKSIVCGVDGSADSQAALAVAIDLAARLRLRLIMANVVEPIHAPYVGSASLGGGMLRPAAPDHRPAGRRRERAARRAQHEQWDSSRQIDASSSATQPSGSPISPMRKKPK